MSGIEAKNLVKYFGAIRAVDDIGFAVPRGQILGFLGPNGAGKTTTMRLLTGFLRPDRGGVTVEGQDLENSRLAAQAAIGYLPEGAPLYTDMRAIDYLRFSGEIRGLRGKKLDDALAFVIEACALSKVLPQRIEELSKGFKRRIGLAQALIHNPPVLILDEPTDGLDPNQKHDMRQLLRKISGDKAIILSTHILEEVEALCHRLLIIAGGKIKADTTPAAFAANGGLEQNFRKLTTGAA